MSEPAEILFEERPRKAKQFRVLLVGCPGGETCSVRTLLAPEPEYNLLEALRDPTRIHTCMHRHKPHLVLLDFVSNTESGFSLLQRLRNDYPYKPALVLSDESDPLFLLRVIRERANGCLSRKDVKDSLVPAMQRVLLGGIYVSAAVRRQLIKHMDTTCESSSGRANILKLLRNRVAACRGYGLDAVQISKFLHLPVPQVTVLLEQLGGSAGSDPKRGLDPQSPFSMVNPVGQAR